MIYNLTYYTIIIVYNLNRFSGLIFFIKKQINQFLLCLLDFEKGQSYLIKNKNNLILLKYEKL